MKTSIKIIAILLLIIIAVVFYYFKNDKTNMVTSTTEINNPKFDDPNIERDFEKFGLRTDTSVSSIDLSLVFSGGPGKDGIPAISNPKFDKISKSEIDDVTFGILVDIDGIQKFYPYSILVWHEVVNDYINDTHFSATFCPLCGTGIVFNRNINGKNLDFGISGLLFESNLLMFDRQTESLWSQARGEAVVGDYTGATLDLLPMQLISFKEVKEKYPQALIMSTDTGHNRNYKSNPYVGYEDTEDLYFPVSVSDKRLKAKELMYVVSIENKSIAFARNDLENGTILKKDVEGNILDIERSDNEIFVKVDGESVPGYYEMWFSWATHHQDDGVLLEVK